MTPGTITFMGSGEMSASMGKVHRAIMSRLADPVQAVFLDTPAGFQLNADQISARAVAYFERRFKVALSVASFKSATRASKTKVANILSRLRSANYIFAGPGSPSYTIRNWANTAVLEIMAQRLASGAHLVFASAAAIAMSRHALPVYEIYKVGKDPQWMDGLDMLGPYGMELAIVPHWNNREGGTHDTRFCFMGEPRLRELESRLPPSAVILGIDEYTACVMDLASREAKVMGTGQGTVRRQGAEFIYPAGTVFPLDCIGMNLDLPPHHDPINGPRDESGGLTSRENLLNAPEKVFGSLVPLIELAISVRSKLRAAGQWELADEIRDHLAEMGIALDDGSEETSWRKG